MTKTNYKDKNGKIVKAGDMIHSPQAEHSWERAPLEVKYGEFIIQTYGCDHCTGETRKVLGWYVEDEDGNITSLAEYVSWGKPFLIRI